MPGPMARISPAAREVSPTLSESTAAASRLRVEAASRVTRRIIG